MSTNASGVWQRLTLPADFPNRYIAGIAIEPADASGRSAYIGFNGFSRRWTEGPDMGIGHVWKTSNAGATWTDMFLTCR